MKSHALVASALASIAVLAIIVPASLGSNAKGSAQATPSSAKTQAKVIHWNLPMVETTDDYKYLIVKEFTNLVSKRTHGGLQITIHPAGELYNTVTMWPALLNDQAQIAVAPTVGIASAQPQLAVANLPYLATTPDRMQRVITALVPYYTQQLSKLHAKYLMTLAWPPNDLFTASKVVTNASDWKGLKIRVFDTNTANMVSTLGGTPVNIDPTELYDALSRGIADGALASPSYSVSSKTYTILKNDNVWQFELAATAFLAVNQSAWNSLPAAYQKVIQNVITSKHLQQLMWKDWAAANDKAVNVETNNGVHLNAVSPGQKNAVAALMQRTVWQTWAKSAGAAGQQAIAIVNKTK